ncbi:F-box protein PP2-B15 [Cajanus cajan]|uniref:F-box protein PP2-B15 n=1 Tax=Cajanus cajan TaxID=3821 RepID=A0A151TVW9_CAJCA|nr:F-box protein PP2-B15 [Cajanus cajan]KYP71176.1 F-box protein PP2-B15 [Cajanus cajan]
MELLPDDCFAHILSFTSPQDVCRSSLVSSILQSMADSDAVWEKFLPFNYQEIVSRLVAPLLPCSSKKDLFVKLCKPQPIDDGNKMFWIEKRTGKICYLLSARELSITWGNSLLYWSWKPIQGSRFEEAAELITTCWLEIKGSIKSGMLSPKTLYGAYLKVRIADRAYGLDSLPSEVSVEVGNRNSRGTLYIHSHCKTNRKSSCHCNCKREDEWSEIELGSFYTHSKEEEEEEEVRMCLKEVKGVHLKGGLIVDGIEVRPKLLKQDSTCGP